jgi:C-terminal peptidase prc
LEGAKRLEKDYVKEENLGELVDWAIRGIYRRLEEKIPQEIQDDLAKAKGMTEKELFDLLVKARDRFGVREDLADHKDIDIALQRMTSHLDPYTTYVDPKTKDALTRDIGGEFMGVGIQIRKDLDRDMLKVISPLRGSPAYRAKIMAGDIITNVTNYVDKATGKELAAPETISTKGMPINDAVEKILGKKGTQVKLTIEREGEDKPLEFTLTREPINVESVLGFQRKEDDNWDYMIDPKSKIAYIRLTSFQKNSFTDMEKIVKELNAQGIKGIILDLRNDPGGLLGSAVNISDLFIDDGTIVEIRKRNGEKDKFRGQTRGSYLDFPMVCMVNGNSASGSEIVAACLQDHKRAIILGERSYGKGSVQNIDDFDGGLLKMTNATFWRPSGKNLNKSSTSGKDEEDWGVRPDAGYEIKLSHAEQDALIEHQQDVQIIPRRDRPAKNTKPEFKDRQLDKAVEYLRDQIKIAGRTPDKKGT